ncbi:MAG: FAD-binding protein [Saprospiraceae bacterium]|nr:FAD-binding protein [Saprospiraceae bacterium]
MTSWSQLKGQFGDRLQTDHLHRVLYATDASVYRELPAGVAWPRDKGDLDALVSFAHTEEVPLIPRTAGTSLAGQVVGSGLVVDFSRHMNQILEVDMDHRQVVVQPGVIRDELNAHLHTSGLFFGPNTATANRCMIGGMVGNNSCGSTSIVYGSTRDKLVALDTLLSDGSDVRFAALTEDEWQAKLHLPQLEGVIYRHLRDLLSRKVVAEEIRDRFPKPSVTRRNTGYALDRLLDAVPFTPDGPALNLCHVLAGSEGTLALSHQITLQLDPLPPPHVVLVCAHFHSIREMTESVLLAMKHPLYACELMDKTVLDCTRHSRPYQAHRSFLEGDPAAVLICECRGHSKGEADNQAEALVMDLKIRGTAYACPVVGGKEVDLVWALRAAGLGVLANLPGDPKAVACIEDTAVDLEDLPDYIDDLDRLIRSYGQRAAYFAHAGAGELHVRPILNLKEANGQKLFQEITSAVAELVREYKGSFSGEHGDGRLRGSFIPALFGEQITGWFEGIKDVFDPHHLFNPGKIVRVPPMLQDLRYVPDQQTREFQTTLDFSDAGGILRAAERCNGSGDCRKLPFSGATMCPSYQATRQEKDTTRARANALREFLTKSELSSPFTEPALAEVMDLCISCKGCARECPSSVDMASMKAEWQHQVHQQQGIPLKHRIFGRIADLNRWISPFSSIFNRMVRWTVVKYVLRSSAGIDPRRSLPALNATRFSHWYASTGQHIPVRQPEKKTIWLFADEFTEYYDLQVGQAAVRLLHGLGYRTQMPRHKESGRAAISKGMLHHARKVAQANIASLYRQMGVEDVIIGLEPSAFLTLRDEYLKLAGPALKEKARILADRSFLIEEFLYQEAQSGNISADDFSPAVQQILLHGHCHQKALSEQSRAAFLLGLPAGHQVQILATGCCGMAGSFGYEARYYDISLQIGELVLFPEIRKTDNNVQIAASGHSCRHQIMDGTGRKARHVVEILEEKLI